MNTVLITGNTYPVKDQIKALGGRWNPYVQGWVVPADKAEQAKALVASAPKEETLPGRYRKPGYRKASGKCKEPGCTQPAKINGYCPHCYHDSM